jgi:adenylyl-sulfate kinase
LTCQDSVDVLVRPGRRRGFILWFTGLSGAGKTTLARATEPIICRCMPTEVLDGDEIRAHLSKGLSFSKEDRDVNVRRIGFVARLLARNGVAAIVAAISPYQEVRDEIRRQAEGDGVPFFEVYVRAALATLEARDVKGLYRRALSGDLPHFSGISDPYEAPADPEIVVDTDAETIQASLARLTSALSRFGVLSPVTCS